MKEFNFEKKISEKTKIFEKEKKDKGEIDPEYILYHNAFRLALREGEPIDFFGPKSEPTKRINNALKKTAQLISEAKTLIKSDKFLQLKTLLLDPREEEIRKISEKRKWSRRKLPLKVRKLLKMLSGENLPKIKEELQRYREPSDILYLRKFFEDQLGSSPTDESKLKKLQEIRDHSFFLTKENESSRGLDLVSFDIRRLLKYGFKIYEADYLTANSIFCGFSTLRAARKYLNSLREINSPNDCLKYTAEDEDDYDACSIRTVYTPYCPEYLIQSPTPESIAKLIKEQKEELLKMASKYRIAWRRSYSYRGLTTEKTEEGKEGENIDIDNLDPKNSKDYQLIVNMLFNESIIDIKWSE